MKKIAFLTFLLGLLLGAVLAKNELSFYRELVIDNTTTETPNPLDSLIKLTLPKGDVDIQITKDGVYFQPFENANSDYKFIEISKDGYPKLFEQGPAGMSFITADKQVIGGNNYVLLSNNQPSHGAYIPAFELLVDPISKTIREYSENRTQVLKYVQTSIPKESQSGKCWTISIATPSNENAWRCTSGNYILDPCFDVGNHKVVCEPEPGDDSSGTTLSLTEPLPVPDTRPLQEDTHAWLYELEGEVVCGALTGTANTIDQQMYYYVCSDKGWMIGDEVGGISKADTFWLTNIAYPEGKTVKKVTKKILKVWY